MPCCGTTGSEELYLTLKKEVMKRGLVQEVWVTKTGCQGLCDAKGATIVIYPQGVWLQKVTMDDVEKGWSSLAKKTISETFLNRFLFYDSMTHLDEQQVLDQLLGRLEALRPDSWELISDEQGDGLRTRRHYLAHLGSKDEMLRTILSRRAYREMSIEEFSGLTIYTLQVHMRMENLIRHTEENPLDDSRLVQLYRRVDDYWSPRIPEIQARRNEGKLETLARILGNGELVEEKT